MNEERDRHLETPGEANRDKHINFLAIERGEEDPADETLDTLAPNKNDKCEESEEQNISKSKNQSKSIDRDKKEDDPPDLPLTDSTAAW
jgi:hypothetical protein